MFDGRILRRLIKIMAKTIATEAVLRRLEASKAACHGADPAAYTAAADKLAREFREKYPDTIPSIKLTGS
jgi:hypothetical protein